jgi:hypothetical protein
MESFDQIYYPTADVDASLRPLLERLHLNLICRPFDSAAIKAAMLGLLEFLASPSGRTDANCRAVDSFLMLDEAWSADELPQSFVDILSDMSGALHDTVLAPDIAANFESTPEQLLERAKQL